MSGTNLAGLEGSNPLGLLAALGLQALFDSESDQPRLWWTRDATPVAVVDGAFPVERIVERAIQVIPRWLEGVALSASYGDRDDAKFEPVALRRYLAEASSGRTGSLAAALVAEGSVDGRGLAKPSDLYFTAGQQRFRAMARQILEGVREGDFVEALLGPWAYSSELPSLRWDVVDDRQYALGARDPAGEKKLTNPGAEALAILGLTRYPVFAGSERTLTTGCSGNWKRGAFTWPLWEKPAGPGAVASLVAHIPPRPDAVDGDRYRWFSGWSVFIVLQSAIRRSDQGGYGTFGPARAIWVG